MRISLFRLTLLAWASWLITLIVMAVLSLARVLHPSFLSMAIPLAVQLLAIVAIFFAGSKRILRGPRRRQAAFLSWFGLMPTLLMAAYIEYLFNYVSGRNQPHSQFVTLAESMTSLLGEPFVRAMYPFRYEGERFEMWSDTSNFDPQQMATMDAHLRAMEESLGERSNYKVYWVRGPVFGISGRYGFGWALGSSATVAVKGSDGLNYVDRHEIAHFAMEQLLPYGNDVPTLLREGWAEAHSGNASIEANRRYCLTVLHNQQILSLRELTSPTWYHIDDGPVYPQGGVLVDYLLRRFGHEKFLKLCRSCRPQSFAEDVRRVFGVALDELDDDYQQDLLKTETPQPTDREYLLSMKLGDRVLPEQWRQFVDDYCAGAIHLKTAFQQSSVKLSSITENVVNGKTGKEVSTFGLEQYDNNNECQACTASLTLNGLTTTSLLVVTPELEFRLAKNRSPGSWQLQEYKTHKRSKKFTSASDDFNRREYLWFPLCPLSGKANGSNFQTTITEIEADRRPMRIHFENCTKNDGIPLGKGWWDLDPGRDYVLTGEQWENSNAEGPAAGIESVTVEYETIDGNPVLKEARTEFKMPQRKSQSRTVKLESCKFGPPPPEVFQLSTYGKFDLNTIKTVEPATPSTPVGILTWIAGSWTGFGLLTLLGLSMLQTCRRWRRQTGIIS